MRAYTPTTVRTQSIVVPAILALNIAILSACGDNSNVAPATTPSAAASRSIGQTTPTPSPSLTDPKLRAFSQAEAAYANFLEVFNAVKADGGANPDRLGAVASGVALEQARTNAALYRERKWRQVAAAHVLSTKGQSFKPDVKGHAQVTLASCQDIQKAEAVDDNGKSVAKQGSVKFLLYTVTMQSETTDLDAPWTVNEYRNAQVKTCD